MLYDLDLTLKALLEAELFHRFSPSLATPISITFCAPDRQLIGAVGRFPALNVFLYDIRENQELRQGSWSVVRQNDGTATREPPPVRVDCSYLITMWASIEHDFRVEHEILGEVMQVLLRYPKLPPNVLQGSLQGTQLPGRASVLGQVKLQSWGEFWQAMGGKPKATLNYTLTLAVSVHADVETLPLVMNSFVSGASNV
jgi:Pvc16 N-terminal domain